MFYYIEGRVAEIEPNLAIIDCGGVGYGLNTTANTISRLKPGEKAKLYVYSNIREDAFDLYGFFDKREKRSFEMLLGVSGVGPKAALSILSSSTSETLAMAIVSGDEKALTVAPGIGKKLAQRILLELKDKMSKETDGLIIGTGKVSSSGGSSSKLSDAVSALAVLGFCIGEFSTVLKDIDTETCSLEDIIRQALKKMVK